MFSIYLSMVSIPSPILTQTPQFCQISRRCIFWSLYRFHLKFWQVVCYQNKNSCDDFWINRLGGICFMSPWKLRFSVFVMKTYSSTGKRNFNLGLCFCFFRFCSLPRALTSALIAQKRFGNKGQYLLTYLSEACIL